MAALPAEFLDTGKTCTFLFEADAFFRAQSGSGKLLWNGWGSGGDHVETLPSTAPPGVACGRSDLGTNVDSYTSVDAVLFLAGVPVAVLAQGPGDCTVGSQPPFLPAVHCTASMGPLRLGVTVDSENRLVYEWFSDSATIFTLTVGGHTVSVSTGPALPVSQGPVPSVTFGFYENAGNPALASTLSGIQWTNLVVDGYSLASQGPFAFLSRGTSIALELPVNQIGSAGTLHWFGPPFRWTVDLAVIDENGASIATDTLYDGSTVTTPTTVARLLDVNNTTVGRPQGPQYVGLAQLTDPWLSAQTIRPHVEDEVFEIEGNVPKDPTLGSPTLLSVGTLTVNSPDPVLHSATAWVTDSGTVAIGGTPTSPTFTVTSGPAAVHRDLAGHQHDGLTPTKRTAYGGGASDDVWGWSLYAYLDLTANASAPATVSVVVSWSVILEDGSVGTIDRTYPGISFPMGASTQRVDLLFPAESGRPFYGERVDRVTLTGLPVGVFSLTGMDLVAVENAYLKVGGPLILWPDNQIARGGIMIAQDGAFAVSQWGVDTPISGGGSNADVDPFPDYRLDNQNGVFWWQPTGAAPQITEHLGGAIGATKDTIAQVFAEGDGLEGLSMTHSTTALDNALSDSFGNTIVLVRTPTWLLPVMPEIRVPPNSAQTLQARFVWTDVAVAATCPGVSITVFQRNRLGHVIEAMAVTAAAGRSPAAQTVQGRIMTGLVPAGGDPVLGSATTDASGYCRLAHRTGIYTPTLGEFGVYFET